MFGLISKKKHDKIVSEVRDKYRRDFLSRKEIENLPIIKVDHEEEYELLCNPKLVPTIYYADENLKPLKGEIGYTKYARYVR